MREKSVILNWIWSVLTGLYRWYENSVYYKIVSVVIGFFSRGFQRSGTYRFFTSGRSAAGGMVESAVNGVFSLLRRIFGRLCRYFSDSSKYSVLTRLLQFISKNWYRISIRYYSVFVLAFSVISMAMDTVRGQKMNQLLPVFAVVALIGCLLKPSIGGLFEGSYIRKMFGVPPLKGESQVFVKEYVGVTVSLAAGTIVGILTLVPMWYIILAGCIGVLLILHIPMLGAVMAVVLMPFLPTMAVVGLILLTAFSMLLKYLSGEGGRIQLDGYSLSIIGMLGVVVYGVLNSYDMWGSIPIAMVYLCFISAFFIVRKECRKESIFFGLIDAIIVAGTFVALYGIYQKFTGLADTTWTDTALFENVSDRVYATFGNPNVLGEYLLILIPITLGRFFYTKKNNQRMILFIALALQCVTMVLTYSRGCWLGLLAVIAIMLAFQGKKVIGFGILAMLFVPFVLPESVIERFTSIGNMTDTSTSYRVYIWEGTLRMLKDYWITGVGLGTGAFNMVYPFYSLNAVSAPHPHNLYLHILSEVGIVGFIAFLCTLVAFFKAIGTAGKQGGKYLAMSTALGSGMIGYLLQGMFDNVWYNYRIYFFYFIILALAAVLADLAKQHGAMQAGEKGRG